MWDMFGFIFVFIILYFFYKRNKSLDEKVENLDLHLQILKRQLEDVAKGRDKVQEEVQDGLPIDKQEKDRVAQIPIFRPPVEEEKPKILETPKTVPDKGSEPKRKSRTKTEWELLIGGKWLNWIGAVALFLGTAFFMKYAFDNDWINEFTRVAIGAVFGFILLFMGGRFAKRGLKIFSQGLVGAAIAVLYTSVFAAYHFYELVPQLVAIILMLLVTALSFWQAIYYQSLPIAIIGWFGAYATPFLFPGGGTTLGLMGYLAFVTVGISALVWRKRSWSILYYLSFIATYLIFFGWSIASNSGEHTVFLVSLTFFWLVFYLFDLRILFHERAAKYEKMVSIFNTILLGIGLIWHFPHTAHYRVWFSTCMLLVAILYLIPIVYFYARKTLSKANQWQTARQSITFLLFLLVATGVYFHFQTFLFVASIEIGAMIWWGLRYQVRYVERFVLGLMCLSTFVIFIYTVGELGQLKPIFNWVLWNDLIGVIVLLWSAHLYNQQNAVIIRNSLHAIWAILLAVGIYVESQLFFLHVYPRDMYMKLGKWDYISHVSYITDLSVAFCLMVYAASLGWFGLKRRVNSVLIVSNVIIGIMLIQLVILGRTYPALNYFTPVWNIRVFIFMLAIGLIFGSYRLWRKLGLQHPWYKWYRLSIILSMVVLLFELVTVEIIDGFTKQINLHHSITDLPITSYLENLEFYTLVLVWIFSSVPMYILGVRLRYRLLMYFGLSTLGIGTIPILFHGLTFYSYDHFFPIINLRFLSLICTIGILFFFYRYMKKNEDIKNSLYLRYIRQTLFFIGVLAVFLCVTLEISDTFEANMLRYIHESEEVIRLKNLQQLSISIAWLLLSCFFLWVGIWQKKQSVRIMSICVFGLSILKIFFFDLSFLTTLYRIFSFMGLGIILLSVSFIYQKYKHWFSAN
ncbi:DUF2339 domain-containing protein [Shimazuella sp. AN120528]|uniref:DUF2339 domain-containing protein n=1 Tax=Shimazuella soli TaxID=1892854 RepID=UPI001F112BAF|nr:DUF2339 domain-containing protein [Shimazuella soli]MCH5583621.1 DUF2339 domain-containing protein [Shimazuella soli]